MNKDIFNSKYDFNDTLREVNEKGATSFLGKEAVEALNSKRRKNLKDFEVLCTAKTIMKDFRNLVSPELWHHLYQMLVGLDEDSQLELADDFYDFVWDYVIHVTDDPTLNILLQHGYCLIAAEYGIKATEIKKIFDYSKGV